MVLLWSCLFNNIILTTMKRFWKWRHDFMVNNPILTAYIGFAKGILLTILVYEFIIKQ